MTDARWHNNGKSVLMAEKHGWCMVRRPGGIPYTIMAKDWYALPTAEEGEARSKQYAAALGDSANPLTPHH